MSPTNIKATLGSKAILIDGCAFQCYAPEGENSLSEICRKHKKKITSDLNKFQANEKKLTDISGATKIRRWILVVPEHCSSDVVTHCQSKTKEINELAVPLPYVTDEFQV